MSITEFDQYSRPWRPGEAAARAVSNLFQRFGLNGGSPGTSGRRAKVFLYSLAVAAAVVGAVNTENVISIQGARHDGVFLWAVIDEGSSWLTFVAFFWIIWLGWYLAPLSIRPRWKLVLHVPAILAFCGAHVGGFLLLRTLAYRLATAQYEYGPLVARFSYEFRKDALAYALFFAGTSLIDHLLQQQQPTPDRPALFDIRDGTKITRVAVSDILAVMSAGNYVEFAMLDGRRLLMRSTLSAIERDLVPRGFLRVHRSWIINVKRVQSLNPTASGDCRIELSGNLTVPLSRRFKETLAQLRAAPPVR